MDIANFPSTRVDRNTKHESGSHCAKYCAGSRGSLL